MQYKISGESLPVASVLLEKAKKSHVKLVPCRGWMMALRWRQRREVLERCSEDL